MTGRPARRVTLWKRPAPWTAQTAAHRALENAQDAFSTRSHRASSCQSRGEPGPEPEAIACVVRTS
jgi:hypothetical protein